MDMRELERYFKPIYYVEYEEQETGMLFCKLSAWATMTSARTKRMHCGHFLKEVMP